jgi:transcriptional regulator with XRE-family HTH domain
MSVPSAPRPSRNTKKTKYGRGTGNPDPVDIHVGARMRARRQQLEMSQEKLGDLLGLTFQQIQKYERGKNRVGASRLFDMTAALDVSIAYFFEGLPQAVAERKQAFAVNNNFVHDPLIKSETKALITAYYNIPDRKIRRRLFELVKASAAGDIE